jgi:hypothetical protein
MMEPIGSSILPATLPYTFGQRGGTQLRNRRWIRIVAAFSAAWLLLVTTAYEMGAGNSLGPAEQRRETARGGLDAINHQ